MIIFRSIYVSSVLAWRIPRTGEPCGLPSMGSHRVGCDWSDLAAAACFYKWHHFISLHGWVIFHCVCVCVWRPHLLYPFHCWWTFRLLLNVLAIVNSAAMNMEANVFFQIMVFFGYMTRSWIAGHTCPSYVLELSLILPCWTATVFLSTFPPQEQGPVMLNPIEYVLSKG